jgi:hypothetical protein
VLVEGGLCLGCIWEAGMCAAIGHTTCDVNLLGPGDGKYNMHDAFYLCT